MDAPNTGLRGQDTTIVGCPLHSIEQAVEKRSVTMTEAVLTRSAHAICY